MRDEVSEIYDQLAALNLPGKAWELIARLNNINMMHPDHIAAETRKAKDAERKRLSRKMSAESSDIPIILDNNLEGGVGETNPDASRDTPYSILRTVLDDSHAKSVIEYRKRHKRAGPLNLIAARRLVNQFKQWPNPDEAAAEMMLKGWSGCNPEWRTGGKDQPKNGVDRGPDSWSAVQHQYREKYGADAFKVYCSERENK